MEESGWLVSNMKISIILKKGWLSDVRVSFKWEEWHIYMAQFIYNSFKDGILSK